MGLTNKQQIFINEYLQCWNATEAARRAGYSEKTAYSIGQENLRKPEIATEIRARIAERAMSADEVLDRLAQQARGDMGEFLEFKNGTPHLNLKDAHNKGLFRLVKKLKYDTHGRPEFELYDAQAALVHIGKQHGLFVDRHVIQLKLEKEIGGILDVLERVLDPDSYERALQALSGPEDSPAETATGEAEE